MVSKTANQIVRIFPDEEALAEGAAALVADRCAKSVGATGRFTVALAGGRTPRGLYRRLASEGFRARIPWCRVHIFWSDERCVPPSSAQSNYRMAAESLLCRVPVPPGNVHRMPGELPSQQGAASYEQTLRTFFGSPGGPRFNLMLLGLGSDGHVASLFPYSKALLERERSVVASYSWAQASPRLTVTLPVINRADAILFLVTGKEKRSVVSRVLHKATSPARLPARAVQPEWGELFWCLDEAAAGEIATP